MSYGEPELSPQVVSQWLANEQATNRELRAEIERLSQKLKGREAVSRLQDEREQEKDAEIERLKAALDAVDDHGRALSFMETLKAQKAEIARLKEMNETLMQNASENADREHVKDLLITELADALEAKTSCVEDDDIALVKRAKEAIK